MFLSSPAVIFLTTLYFFIFLIPPLGNAYPSTAELLNGGTLILLIIVDATNNAEINAKKDQATSESEKIKIEEEKMKTLETLEEEEARLK